MSCVGVYKVKEKGMDVDEKFQRIASEEREQEIMKCLGLVPIRINLEKKIVDDLEDLSKAGGIPLGALVRNIIKEYLNKNPGRLTRTQYYEFSDRESK